MRGASGRWWLWWAMCCAVAVGCDDGGSEGGAGGMGGGSSSGAGGGGGEAPRFDAAPPADGGGARDAEAAQDAASGRRDAAVIEADAAVVEGDAAVPDPDAAVPDPDAAVLDPDAAVLDPDAAVLDPDAAVLDPDAAVLDPDAVVLDPDAAVLDPDAVVLDPDAAVLDPDAAVLDPDAAVADPDAGPRCPADTTLCGVVCHDLTTDPNHCGGCDQPCRADQQCNDGVCDCPGGQLDCDGACVDPTTDSGHCGGCGQVCRAEQACVDAACACPPGLVDCAGACVDVTTSDPAHCGGCGVTCRPDQICDGTCTCPPGQLACGGACVDPWTDDRHCGGCDRGCAAGEGCVAGACLDNGCADGQREGFTALADFPDLAACSGGWGEPGLGAEAPGCGRLAGDDGPAPAGPGCTVQDLCAEGWRVCPDAAAVAARMPEGASCADLAPTLGGAHLFATAQRGSNSVGLSCDGAGTNDVFGCGAPGVALRPNCGVLNRAIGGGEPAPWSLGARAAANVTEWSTATKPGAAGGGVLCCRIQPGECLDTLCGAACVDLDADDLNCGACGAACRLDQQCSDGACACPPGLLDCGGACVDPASDDAHCGGCDQACGDDRACVEGACQCDAPLLGCGRQCVDPAVDPLHCGGCDQACGPEQACTPEGCRAVGCADGEREGFTDLLAFPAIAACSGGFGVAGLEPVEPACQRAGGDDGPNPTGAGCVVDDLCAPGWHVCADGGDVAAHLPAGATCADLAPTVGESPMFVTRQRGSNTVGLSCDGLGTNDVFGCGAPPANLRPNCAPLNRVMGGGEAAPWELGPRAAVNITEWSTVRKPGPARGGVLCCAD
ncbi:MAG: hypothetical protein H6704_07705 [Myxococcales bacterium]|nr:hypothetical protein [Myxococcales bacterium]